MQPYSHTYTRRMLYDVIPIQRKLHDVTFGTIFTFFYKKHENHFENVLFRFCLPRGILPSWGWGRGGVILGPFLQFFNKKHENHLTNICFRLCLPRGSFCLPSRGWGPFWDHFRNTSYFCLSFNIY